MSAHRLIICLLFGALTLLDVGCIVVALAAPDERPIENAQDSSGRVMGIVSKIQRADYEGDRAALRELHEDLGPFLRNEGISSRVLYWRGFALWRRAFNGFNDGADAKELEDDLQLAAAEFKEALAQDPAFVDAKIAMASCLMTLTFLHQKQGDAAGVKVLVSQFVPLLREAANSAPDNPRVLWVLAMSQFNNPPERGGGQEKGIETNLRGLEAARAQRNHPTGPLDPSWGEPELLMSLAWSNLNRETPDLEAAEQYAQDALNLVPYWHYVRDILLPQIQAAKAKREQSVVIERDRERPRLYRVILPVADIEQSAKYYTELLGVEGVRVSPGRHYFDCGGVILALYDPKADGDDQEPRANLEHVYFAVSDLEAAYKRAEAVGGLSKEVGDGDLPMGKIAVRPWGERSFYLRDPTGNPLCFVDENTVFTGR